MEKTEVMTHKHVSPALELLLLEFILIYVSNFPLPPPLSSETTSQRLIFDHSWAGTSASLPGNGGVPGGDLEVGSFHTWPTVRT